MPTAIHTAVRRRAPGDDRVVEALVRDLRPAVAEITRGFRLEAADAEDVQQDTWVALLERLRRPEDPRTLGAWVARTTRRACLLACQGGIDEVLAADPRAVSRPGPASWRARA
jgi:DNA-directed RNA polymerase specialized sigma24 family protein